MLFAGRPFVGRFLGLFWRKYENGVVPSCNDENVSPNVDVSSALRVGWELTGVSGVYRKRKLDLIRFLAEI